MLTMDDKGGRGGGANADKGLHRRVGVWLILKPPKKCLKMAKKFVFLFKSSGNINKFCQIMCFLPKKIGYAG